MFLEQSKWIIFQKESHILLLLMFSWARQHFCQVELQMKRRRSTHASNYPSRTQMHAHIKTLITHWRVCACAWPHRSSYWQCVLRLSGFLRKETCVCVCLHLSVYLCERGIRFALRRSFKEMLNDSDLVMCFKLDPDAGLGKVCVWSLKMHCVVVLISKAPCLGKGAFGHQLLRKSFFCLTSAFQKKCWIIEAESVFYLFTRLVTVRRHLLLLS